MHRALASIQAGLFFALLFFASGCLQRSLLVESNPPGARVFFNGQEKGTTPVEFDFKWYGGHKVRLEKEGYAPQSKTVRLSAPLHHQVPLDLATAVLPVRSKDKHSLLFNLEPEAQAEKE